MRIQYPLHSRSATGTNNGGGGGLGKSTIIFIVVGVGRLCSFSSFCQFVPLCVICPSPIQFGLRDRGCIAYHHTHSLPRCARNPHVSPFAATFYGSSPAALLPLELTFYNRSYLANTSRSPVCLLVILIGFYLVSRPRAARSASPNIPNTHPEHSPTTHSPRPQCERDMSERWKIWKTWHHTNGAEPTVTPDIPPSVPAFTITNTSQVSHTRDDSKTSPSNIPRPSQSRRVTSLSIATSFSHSHITEQALSELCASAYDLDGDLETEMLHSARDDIWLGHPLAVEDGCGNVGGIMEARGNVTPIVEGSVEGDVSTRHTTQCEGGDYENLDACRSVAIGSNGVEGGVSEVDKVGQAFQ